MQGITCQNMVLQMLYRQISAHCVDMNLAMLYINVNKLSYSFCGEPQQGNHVSKWCCHSEVFMQYSRTEGATSLRMAVQLCDDHRSNINFVAEGAGLSVHTDTYHIDSFCHHDIKIYSTPSYKNIL